MFIYVTMGIKIFLGFLILLLGVHILSKFRAGTIETRRYLEEHVKNLKSTKKRVQQDIIRIKRENDGLSERVEKIVKLFETSKSIGATLSFENIYKIIGSTLGEICDFSRAELVIYKSKDEEERGFSLVRFSPEGVPEGENIDHPTEDIFLLKNILLERHERSILFVGDVKRSLLAKQIHLESPYQSFAVVPLYTADEPIGYLALFDVKEKSAITDLFAASTDSASKDSFNIQSLTILAPQFALGIKKAALYRQVQELSITDGLTKLFLRRFIMERLEEELNRSTRFDLKLCLIMADIDHFKKINDTHGHLVGDVILERVAAILKENVREIDLVGKFGGEEFIIVLPETEMPEAKQITQRLCDLVNEKLIRAYDEEIRVTLSLGISAFPGQARGMQDLIQRADEALYKAKELGRNRVEIWSKS